MKGNPQNIEVGDVVSYTSIGDSITSVVLSVCDQGYVNPENVDAIDGYLVRATVMNKSTICNYPVNELTIVRKWNDTSIAPQELRPKEPTFTVVIKKSDNRDTIAIVSDCIKAIKERLQEAEESAQNINGTPPCVSIDVSGEVTFTKFWIDQVIAFTEKYADDVFYFKIETERVMRHRPAELGKPHDPLTIEEFISSYVGPATTDYLRKYRKSVLLNEGHKLWCFTNKIGPNPQCSVRQIK